MDCQWTSTLLFSFTNSRIRIMDCFFFFVNKRKMFPKTKQQLTWCVFWSWWWFLLYADLRMCSWLVPRRTLYHLPNIMLNFTIFLCLNNQPTFILLITLCWRKKEQEKQYYPTCEPSTSTTTRMLVAIRITLFLGWNNKLLCKKINNIFTSYGWRLFETFGFTQHKGGKAKLVFIFHLFFNIVENKPCKQ